MVKNRFFSFRQCTLLASHLVAFLLGLNVYSAFIPHIRNKQILDYPRIKTIKNENIANIATTPIAIASKIQPQSQKFIASNEPIDIDPPLSAHSIHKIHPNSSASIKKNVNSAVPIPSISAIVPHTDMGHPKPKLNDGAKITSTVELPTPIFIASLPKSATTSTSRFFQCGKYKVADHGVNTTLLIGKCYKNNVLNGRPPFERCGDRSVWSDTGYQGEKGCYYPNVDGLEALYESYPNATVILMTRSPDSWYKSLQRYKGGKLKMHMILCNATGFPGLNATSVDWKNMYLRHQERVRAFARLHPSITYLEFSVDDPKVAKNLEDSTGIKSSCWRVHNVNKKDLNLKEAADAINNQKPGQTLPLQFRDLKRGLSDTLTQLRNLDQLTGSIGMEKRLPIPIFVAGLPDKSVSRRIHDYFTCGGYKSAHYWTNMTNNSQVSIGRCFENNLNNGRPPLEGCGDVEVWTETGYSNGDGQCYHPSVDGLDAFRQAYPNGTIILFKRRPRGWYSALRRNDDEFRRNLELCNATNFPGHHPATLEEWAHVHSWYEIYIQAYGYQHPSLTYLEFSLNDGKLSEHLEAVIGVNASCWK